jgi:hypothetical protein
VIVAVVAVLAGGVFAVSALVGGEGDAGGAENPTAAVQDLFDAAAASDALGVLDSLAPSERGALKDPLVDLVGELQRLEILSADLDLSGISGVELAFDDLELTEAELAPGISVVTIEGGEAEGAIDPADLPLGDFVLDHLDVDELEASSSSGDLVAEDEAQPPALVALEENGKWYVSLWFSIAENARIAAGADLPDFDARIPAPGADTPEDAVLQLIDATTQLDLYGIVGALPPDEMRALQTYATLFLEDGQAGLDGFIDEQGGYEFEITDYAASADVDGDIARVKVDRLEFDAAFQFQDTRVEITTDDGCLDVTVDDGFETMHESVCPDQLDETFPEGEVEVPAALEELTDLDLRVVTTRVGDRWYVSPVRTGGAFFVDLARALDRQDLDDLVDFVEEQGVTVGG